MNDAGYGLTSGRHANRTAAKGALGAALAPTVAPIPRCNRRRLAPKASVGGTSYELALSENAVVRRVLSVPPRHPRQNGFVVDLFAIDPDPVNGPAVSIGMSLLEPDVALENLVREPSL